MIQQMIAVNVRRGRALLLPMGNIGTEGTTCGSYSAGLKSLFMLVFLLATVSCAFPQNGLTFLQFEGKEGPGKGKHIVLVAGDDEYRSEESMPMLAKILSQRFGFKTTVLFPIHPETGEIVPNYQNNIPGLEHLEIGRASCRERVLVKV